MMIYKRQSKKKMIIKQNWVNCVWKKKTKAFLIMSLNALAKSAERDIAPPRVGPEQKNIAESSIPEGNCISEKKDDRLGAARRRM